MQNKDIRTWMKEKICSTQYVLNKDLVFIKSVHFACNVKSRKLY